MELFIPGLIILLLAAFFAFFVIPRTGPMILAIISLLALLAAGVHHYNLFYSEYTLSTWQNGLTAYAPFIVLGLAILFIIAAITYMFAGGSPAEAVEAIKNVVTTPMEAVQEAVINSTASMPPANTATNPLTAAINQGIQAIAGPVSNAAANIPAPFAPAPAPVNNRPNNTRPSPIIPGLGFRASEV